MPGWDGVCWNSALLNNRRSPFPRWSWRIVHLLQLLRSPGWLISNHMRCNMIYSASQTIGSLDKGMTKSGVFAVELGAGHQLCLFASVSETGPWFICQTPFMSNIDCWWRRLKEDWRLLSYCYLICFDAGSELKQRLRVGDISDLSSFLNSLQGEKGAKRTVDST